ncbi:hypothetical protein H2P46_20570 [Mixta sp. Marseille-Q2057]|nr:hypothetical protein [Mixta mediterraneensis]
MLASRCQANCPLSFGIPAETGVQPKAAIVAMIDRYDMSRRNARSGIAAFRTRDRTLTGISSRNS